MDTPAAQAAVRALWMMGKYWMVSYEIFVVYASIVALRTGSVNLIWRHEATLHGLCCAAGVIAFIGFYTMADRYQTQSTEAASVRQGYARQQQALSDYDALVASMVQVWLVLLFGMLTLWVGFVRFPNCFEMPHLSAVRLLCFRHCELITTNFGGGA